MARYEELFQFLRCKSSVLPINALISAAFCLSARRGRNATMMHSGAWPNAYADSQMATVA